MLLFHRVGNEEVVESLDAATGAATWRYAYPTTYRDDFGFDEGPRAVPVVADGIVYTFGAQGQLHAVDLAKGTRVWSEDTMKRFSVPKGFFGAAGSPLVEGGRVIANIGGDKAGIVAFDAKTGKVVWTATDDDASYSSGMAATIGGRRLGGVPDARQPDRPRSGNGRDPVPAALAGAERRIGQRGDAARRRRLDLRVGRVRTRRRRAARRGLEAGRRCGRRTRCCRTTTRRASITTAICTDSTAGRSSARASAPWSFKTGTVKWSQDQFRAGSITLAGDRLLIMREGGELILAPASPQALQAARAGAGAARRRRGRCPPSPTVRLCPQREHARLPRSPALR